MSNEEGEREGLLISSIEQMFEEGVAAGYFERLDRRPDGKWAYGLTEKAKRGDVNWHNTPGSA